MGYSVIVLGIVIVIWGIVLVSKSRKSQAVNQLENVSQEPTVEVVPPSQNTETKSDDFDENKAKGDAFEKFVVKSFNPKYFTLQEWRSDKYVDGVYAVSNHFPDLEVVFDFKSKGINEAFAIECKWRKYFYKNEIEWAKDYQIKNYKDYADKLQIPVYVVIGVGGEPEKPTELFVVPLKKIEANILTKSELQTYRKDISSLPFFWDYETNQLK